MKSRTSQILLRYWNDVRGPRIAPKRLEIEPGRFTAALAESFILERNPDGAYTFRLAGTRICEDFGWELRGTDFRQLAGAHADALQASFDVITSEGAYGVFELEAVAPDGRTCSLEAIVLPLVHTHDRITRFLGAISVLSRPFWIGTMPLTPLSITHGELRWTDGRVKPLQLGHATDPVPALDGVARVVRRDRRLFRVLDGGLSVPAALATVECTSHD